MSPDLPTVLRNKLVAIIRALRGPQITSADRVEVIAALRDNFCAKCGEERSAQCACGPITVVEAEEILSRLVRTELGLSSRVGITVREGAPARFAEMINKRVMT